MSYEDHRLTGSIAAGKSTIVEWINELGIITYDSDCVVHEFLGPNGEAVEDVLATFGLHLGSIFHGIDRLLLGNEVFSSSKKRKTRNYFIQCCDFIAIPSLLNK